jgi:hypothetical protein
VLRSPFRLFLALVATLALPVCAAAQAPDPAADARIHLGPLALDPRFSIQNLGVDSNVNNSADTPERDVTATAGPSADLWLRAGRLRLSGTTGVGWTYFARETGQRSLDLTEKGRADLALVRVVPHVEASFERSRRRPNLEIDERVRNVTDGFGGGLEIIAFPRLSIDLAQDRQTIDYSDGGDAILADSLNRTQDDSAVTMRFVATPLTTFVVRADTRRDRFEFSQLRNSTSYGIVPGVEFKPLALISGSASVGFRSLAPADPAIPDYRGVVAAVQLGYTMRDRLRLAVDVKRDVEYSFTDEDPYYLVTGAHLTITQALGAAWDAVARGGTDHLAYRIRIVPGTASTGMGRTDRVNTVGIGIGRHLNSDVRIGLDIDHVQRNSVLRERSYAGYRVGGSITYGY